MTSYDVDDNLQSWVTPGYFELDKSEMRKASGEKWVTAEWFKEALDLTECFGSKLLLLRRFTFFYLIFMNEVPGFKSGLRDSPE